MAKSTWKKSSRKTSLGTRPVNRSRSYEERTKQGSVAGSLLARGYQGRTFNTDSKGRKVRVFTADDWCRPEDVREWLLNNRVVELDDALEYISQAVLRFLLKEDLLRQDSTSSHFYWVTAKAAAKYELRKVIGCEFPN